MALDLADYDQHARLGVKQFWSGRSSALENDEERSQGGERAGVLGGKNMDGFLAMIKELVQRNGLPEAAIHTAGRPLLTLPGYFRPTKLWDVLVFDRGALVAAIEFKSHVGPSFANNANNRAEEAIGTAQDLWTAIRENAIGNQTRPFLGWLILVEDCEKSRCTVRESSRHYSVFPEFSAPPEPQPPTDPTKRKAPAPRLVSYLARYEILCQRLMLEGLYNQATVVASPRAAAADGAYTELSPTTGLRAFAAGLAGHVATWSAART